MNIIKKILYFTLPPLMVFIAVQSFGRQAAYRTIGGMEFAYIKGGRFMMGSPAGRGSDDERPLHRVEVDSFWMGKLEVTQEQYEIIMGKNPSCFKDPKRPVESVSWKDAVEFCRRFGAMHGVTARLPYEAEWEFAARAGSEAVYFWGDAPDGAYAWYNANSRQGTNHTGMKLANPWGLHDTAGNVWEWCMDWFDQNYYTHSPSVNPRGPVTGRFRVLRGGGWDISGNYLRPSLRERNDPSNRNNVLGFRVAIADLK